MNQGHPRFPDAVAYVELWLVFIDNNYFVRMIFFLYIFSIRFSLISYKCLSVCFVYRCECNLIEFDTASFQLTVHLSSVLIQKIEFKK